MDDFTKQAINEEKYKQLRSADSGEYTGTFESKHYTDVENKTIAATVVKSEEVFNTKYEEDFDKAAKDFWQQKTVNGITKYMSGSTIATFGKELYTINEFLERLSYFIKSSISNELLEKSIPTEGLTEYFNAVNISLKLLGDYLGKENNNIDIVNLSAQLQGFTNGFINSIAKKKIELNKGRII